MEVSLHARVGQHPNIIEWFATGEDATWRWIGMEYAQGGDLFDKIEADYGVPEDVAHVYFQQLVSGVSFMHSKGIAHRDLKPENILLDEKGNLKLADFGMATLFSYQGQKKLSSTMCGSPPYIAPEVLKCSRADRRSKEPGKYSADLVDIWSCGVILFVLLVGNTPWDEPTEGSWEFQEYVRKNGRCSDELWDKIPPEALSLLRGMMNVDTPKRFSFAQIRQHPWFTRPNSLLTAEGSISDPILLATQMLNNLRIDLTQNPTPSQKQAADAMDVEMADAAADDVGGRFSATQPEAPIRDLLFDWERPNTRSLGTFAVSSTQPVSRNDAAAHHPLDAYDSLADEPTMSQFSQRPGIPLSLTQRARQFRDIVPSYSLTRFFSHVPPEHLVQMLRGALHQLNVVLPPAPAAPDLYADLIATLKVKTVDGRQQGLHGDILVEKYRLPDMSELLEVRFVKIKGDPLEWRRFFKSVALLCKDGIYSNEA